MRVPSFEVRNQRSVRHVQCDAVPSLMVIAGPNGTGKSTLLNAIRSSAGYQNIIYLGPHRAMRRQHVQQRHLISTPLVIEDLLARPDAPGFEGIQLISGTRDPWGTDDSANYLKHTICQIEIDFQRAITERYHRDGEIKKGSLPDPWKPLRELCANLLPHLRFFGVDAKNRDQIRCLWTVHGTSDGVDIDELSSGEKSIIQMFFPLVEREIRHLLAEVSGDSTRAARPEQCVLIDEPELHLHPNLQVKVLDYLRVLTAGSQTQVILATHSPTIVESSSFEELFLLRPIDLVEAQENQLVQIASDEERLQLLRSLFGTTSNLTSMQPLVVVEGVREDEARNVVADRKLYRALHPGFDHVTLIAGRGKSECLALVRALEEPLKILSPRLKAVALLDKDYQARATQASGYLLPVSMIENFLLDPDAIWQAIQSVVEKTCFGSPTQVSESLTSLLDRFESEEIEKRAVASLGAAIFRGSAPLADIASKAVAFCDRTHKQFSDAAISSALDNATAAVAKVKASSRRREEFHGKELLKQFYANHLHQTPLSRVVFTFELARHARGRKSVKAYFDAFFDTVSPAWRVSTDGSAKPSNVRTAD